MSRYHRRFVEPEGYLRRWLDPRLASLRVSDVQEYLLRWNWKQAAPDRPQTLVFEEPGGAEGGLGYQFLPDSEADPDYFRRMLELITFLAFFEDRHPVQIIDDIVREAVERRANGAAPQPTQPQEHEASTR
jgi:hypothetical protein